MATLVRRRGYQVKIRFSVRLMRRRESAPA
jgi:hypothetical protein